MGTNVVQPNCSVKTDLKVMEEALHRRLGKDYYYYFYLEQKYFWTQETIFSLTDTLRVLFLQDSHLLSTFLLVNVLKC